MIKGMETHSRQSEFRQFALDKVSPFAELHDRSQKLSDSIRSDLAQNGYFAPFLPHRWGGASMDMVTYGILHEELGRACSSVRTLLTVHDMIAHTILRWGGAGLKERWLPLLAKGEAIGALGISEPNAGSDINAVETVAVADGDEFLLHGQKKWISFGQIADLYLVLCKYNDLPVAFLVERDRPGLSVEPINDMFGTRGSMLALATFKHCRVPKENMIGKPGFGATVAQTALGLGRYSVACGAVGIAQACLDACYEYANSTKRSGAFLKEHQLIQQMISDIITDSVAARLLCRQAGAMRESGDFQDIMHTFIAKYHASTAAMRAADRAVQIHGANGCSPSYPVERLMRDAKIMEIIEGSTQIQQITIANLGFQEFERQKLMAGGDSAGHHASAPERRQVEFDAVTQ
ncbi:acyl-CoA dehydrogenase family protein [Rhodanobacter sp. C05]|uniref:acyl-CoA dehydrogenase family protein n=1 Tax=Rhodanobacter sp. C05 TaxID=1945855 RepID=UPI001C2C1F65|nr:acyl-CoA dehydrogenase family protein [Rhodanobacter sp. C05]